jgi:N-glycosylase/DNA lyase
VEALRVQAVVHEVLAKLPHRGDPAVTDYTSVPVEHLETLLHSINAEKARLDSMETVITQQLEKRKKQG